MVRTVLLSTLVGTFLVGSVGCSDDTTMTLVAEPDPATLVSQWVPSSRLPDVAGVRGRLLGAKLPTGASLELLSNKSCLAGPEMVAFMARCNGHSAPPSGPLVCNWDIEAPELLVLATSEAGGAPFLWLRLAVYRDSTDQQLHLYGLCHGGREYTLARRKS